MGQCNSKNEVSVAPMMKVDTEVNQKLGNTDNLQQSPKEEPVPIKKEPEKSTESKDNNPKNDVTNVKEEPNNRKTQPKETDAKSSPKRKRGDRFNSRLEGNNSKSRDMSKNRSNKIEESKPNRGVSKEKDSTANRKIIKKNVQPSPKEDKNVEIPKAKKHQQITDNILETQNTKKKIEKKPQSVQASPKANKTKEDGPLAVLPTVESEMKNSSKLEKPKEKNLNSHIERPVINFNMLDNFNEKKQQGTMVGAGINIAMDETAQPKEQKSFKIMKPMDTLEEEKPKVEKNLNTHIERPVMNFQLLDNFNEKKALGHMVGTGINIAVDTKPKDEEKPKVEKNLNSHIERPVMNFQLLDNFNEKKALGHMVGTGINIAVDSKPKQEDKPEDKKPETKRTTSILNSDNNSIPNFESISQIYENSSFRRYNDIMDSNMASNFNPCDDCLLDIHPGSGNTLKNENSVHDSNIVIQESILPKSLFKKQTERSIKTDRDPKLMSKNEVEDDPFSLADSIMKDRNFHNNSKDVDNKKKVRSTKMTERNMVTEREGQVGNYDSMMELKTAPSREATIIETDKKEVVIENNIGNDTGKEVDGNEVIPEKEPSEEQKDDNFSIDRGIDNSSAEPNQD